MLKTYLKSKIKSKDLKEGMIVGWFSDGWNECEGTMINDEYGEATIIEARSITIQLGNKSSYCMVDNSVLYFEKSKLELK